ncbi:hypothetical protein N7467_011841 [Penicillium canescens]|nr:hypothetical protein N7467_011841 [Penicillium canescens]
MDTAIQAPALSTSQHAAPPGVEFFEQGLLLFKPSYEEPTVGQIEVLNLMAFYCYSLNRRKTAYTYAGMALRLGTLLGIAKPPSASVDLVDYEHGKRVWWTAICMDLMTCTELSLPPTYRFEDTCLEFPDDTHLPSGRNDFSDAIYLTAQIELCRLKHRIIETALELRIGNASDAHALVEPCFHLLHQWRTKFSPGLEFTEDIEFTQGTLALPEMRTVASMLMRYNQCFILLLRPLLLMQLYPLVREQLPPTPETELVGLHTQCLRAATDNLKIQHALFRCHKIAKFGFWESLHIFSSLTIHVIITCMAEKCPAAFPNSPDITIYDSVRSLLVEMARAGNAASNDHERMIQDIEGLFKADSTNASLPGGIDDMVRWSDFLDGNMGAELFDPFPSEA